MPPKSKVETALIIEDDPDLRQLATWVLEAEGYRVLQAADGNEGIKLTRQNHVDVILLDIKLPLLDGWAVLKEFKDIPVLAEVPVVVFTASADPSLKMQALQLGAADYLSKPVSAEVLKKAIARALKKK